MFDEPPDRPGANMDEGEPAPAPQRPQGQKRKRGDDDDLDAAQEEIDEARAQMRERASKRQRGRRRVVRRGYNMNTLRRSGRYYGFLGRMEGPSKAEADDRSTWYLQFECVDARWFDHETWGDFPNPGLMAGDGRLGTIRQFLQGLPFPQAWDASSAPARHALSKVFLSYCDDIADQQPYQGIFECMVDMSYLRQRHIGEIEPGQWFELVLVERPDDGEETNGIFIALPARQPEIFAGYFDLGLARVLAPERQAIIRALHFPNFEPDPDGADMDLVEDAPQPDAQPQAQDQHQGQPDAGAGAGGDIDMQQRTSLRASLDAALRTVGTLARHARARGADWGDRMGEALEQLMPPVHSPALAGAGAGAGGIRAHVPVAPAPARPLQYSGSPAVNTMVPGGAGAGALHSFVGVVDVGQGNLNMIVDTNHRVLAYYDFGWTLKNTNGPAVKPVLCFCDRPDIIISNFDKDHWGMVDHLPEAYGMRWYVPQEGAGSKLADITGQVRLAGGQVFTLARSVAPARHHVVFPWGYVERCNGYGTNGSGLAAYVCVDDPGAAHVPGVAAPAALTGGGGGDEYATARAAIAAVNHAAPANVAMVRALAATLAPSALVDPMRILHPAQADDAIRTLATAAITQALAHPGAPAAIAPLLPAPIFACLPGNKVPSARRCVANAALAVVQAHNLGLAPARAANQALADAATGALSAWAPPAYARSRTRARGRGRAAWNTCIANALTGWGAAPVANNGAAAVAPNEGFVLLTGDAFYDHVPSSTGVPPIVVGMTAAHHGSAQADNERLGGQGIPWAPGSRQARAAHRAGNANGGVTNAAVDAAMALTAGAVHATVLAETTRAVAAAVAAVHALYAAHGAQITHMAMYQWYASAAAASTLAAMRNADGVLPGLAAVAATQLDPGLIEFMPMESIVARLQQLLVDVRGAPPAVLDEDNLTDLGCFSVDACYWLADAANNAGAATPFAAPHPGTAAQAASNRCVAPKWINLGFANHVATIANTAVTCWNLGAGVAQAALRATVAGAYAVQVGTADARPIIDAMPTNRATMARWAARLAAVGAAARAAGVDPDEVAVAVQAVAQGTYGQASSVRNRPRSGLIAYSYGVKPVSFQHEYLSPNVGGLGHGHPRAVALYKAKGWDQRFNASARAGHANVQGDPASPAGNAALRWDNATHMPRPGMYPGGVAAAPYPYACPTCGNALNFNV